MTCPKTIFPSVILSQSSIYVNSLQKEIQNSQVPNDDPVTFNEPSENESLEIRIGDWLDKNGVFITDPEFKFKRVSRVSKMRDFQLNSELFQKRMNVPKAKII